MRLEPIRINKVSHGGRSQVANRPPLSLEELLHPRDER